MKNCLKSVLALFLFFVFTDINAQVGSEYIFGLNLSSMAIKTKGTSTISKATAGIHYGGCFDLPVTDNFSLQPGLLFSAKGTSYKIDTLEYTISPIYIEVTIISKFSFGSEAIKGSVFVGPYFAFGVGGYKIEPGGDLKSIRYGSGEVADLKAFDVGLSFGTGIKIKSIMISVQYGIGLANIVPANSVELEMKNRVFGISVNTLFANK
jgi:hypothetical protein